MNPMTLYICQHGAALAKDVDPDRPLSDQGMTDVRNMGDALGGSMEVAAVAHSGKTRARQTAELLRERLAPGAPMEARSGLNPNDPAAAFAEQLDAGDGDLLLVGHLPFVGALAAHLLGSDRELLAFEPGAIAALSRDGDGAWRVSWMVTPGLVTG